jgi:PIN domain
VAAFASWHEAHTAAVDALEHGALLPAHVAVETFSVLTRLPPPHRAPAGVVLAFLEARFPEPWLTLPEPAHRRLIRTVTSAGLSGGSVYDALVALTVLHAEATLLTRDRRAAAVYRLVGVSFEHLV